MNLASQDPFPQPVLKQDDKKARLFIWLVSIIIFAGIAFLSRVKFNVSWGFDPHVFATANAIINSMVAVLLVAGLLAVKSKKYL
ncbi:MAG TPA: hypothetical protein VJ279_07150, partial [Hanamia sp.]|nr:hypothetical protein [Hanamia sp.]